MNTKNVQNQLEVSKETIVAQQIDGSKTLLKMLRLPSQIQRGWSRRIDLRLTFDLIDIESGMIVKLPWVNLTSPKAGKQQNWKNWDYAVFKISVRWKMFCALVQWLCYAQLKLKSKKYGRRRNQRRKPKQKEISKSNTQKSQYNATMPLYDSRSIAEINRRLTTFQSPVGLFELEFCSTGASVSFSSSLAGFAALCKLRYGPPSTLTS